MFFHFKNKNGFNLNRFSSVDALFLYFWMSSRHTNSKKKTCLVCEYASITESTDRNIFPWFRIVMFYMEGRESSKRPAVIDGDQIKKLIQVIWNQILCAHYISYLRCNAFETKKIRALLRCLRDLAFTGKRFKNHIWVHSRNLDVV